MNLQPLIPIYKAKMPNNSIELSDISPSDNSPSEGDPDSEDKQERRSKTNSSSSCKREEGQSAESKTSSSLSDSSSDKLDKPTKKREFFSSKDNSGSPTFPVKLHLILSNPEFEKIVACE